MQDLDFPPFPEREIAREYLISIDPELAFWIEMVGPCTATIRTVGSTFEAVSRAIVFQQLSGKAANTIFSRFRTLFPLVPDPELVHSMSDEILHSVGLSRAKAYAIKDLAEKSVNGAVPGLNTLRDLPDETIVEILSTVKGVGRWTVNMFLMFNLGRPDVLPSHDLGIRKGFGRVFDLDKVPDPDEVAAYGKRWAPHRTIASWYLWRVLDLKG